MAAAAAPAIELVALTVLLLAALVMYALTRDPAYQRAALDLAKQIEDILIWFQPSNPEEKKAQEEARRAIEKARQAAKEQEPKPDPEQKPPPNTPVPFPYRDKEEPDECEAINRRLRLHKYKDRGPPNTVPGEQSHHVMQNAYFATDRNVPISTICPAYNPDDAPCLPMDSGIGSDGKTMNPAGDDTAHGRITKDQARRAKRHYSVFNSTGGSVRPKFSDASSEAFFQLTTYAGLSAKEATCVMKAVTKWFMERCGPDIVDKVLRIPGTSDPGPPATSF